MPLPLGCRTEEDGTHEHLFELVVDLGLRHAVDEELDLGVARAVVQTARGEVFEARRPEARPVARAAGPGPGPCAPLRLLVAPTPERVELLQLPKEMRKVKHTW